MQKREICGRCYALYQHEGNHICRMVCQACKSRRCPSIRLKNYRPRPDTLKLECDSCNRFFDTRRCKDLHILNGTCKSLIRCTRCSKTIPRFSPTEDQPVDPHEAECNKIKCSNCNKLVDSLGHLCSIQPFNVSAAEKNDSEFLEIIWDVETRSKSPRDQVQLPYHISALRRCHQCQDISREGLLAEHCQHCGKRWHQFYSRDAEALKKDFFSWLFYSQENQDARCFSHNGSKFDNYFALGWLLDSGREITNHVVNGNRLMSLTAGNNVTLMDTCLFFSRRLSELPNMFNFPELSKGWFPHKLASVEGNLTHIFATIPPMEAFEVRFMNPAERRKFEEWWETEKEKGLPYDFQAQCEHYCKMDCMVLAAAVTKFRNEMKAVTGIDPFRNATTIAGYAQIVWRSIKKTEDEVGIVPPRGYGRNKGRTSKIAAIYLEYLRRTSVPNLRTKESLDGEYFIPSVGHVDGYDPVENTVYSVHGCMWHSCDTPGCPTAEKNKKGMPHPIKTNMTHHDNRQHTASRTKALQRLNYNVKEIWEHEIRNMLASPNHQEFRDFYTRRMRDYAISEGQELTPSSGLQGGKYGIMLCCVYRT